MRPVCPSGRGRRAFTDRRHPSCAAAGGDHPQYGQSYADSKTICEMRMETGHSSWTRERDASLIEGLRVGRSHSLRPCGTFPFFSVHDAYRITTIRSLISTTCHRHVYSKADCFFSKSGQLVLMISLLRNIQPSRRRGDSAVHATSTPIRDDHAGDTPVASLRYSAMKTDWRQLTCTVVSRVSSAIWRMSA